MDCLGANSISTFGGNPLATAGALANLTYLLDHDLQTNAHKVGSQLKSGIHHLADEVPEIAEVRGKGLMIGVEFARSDGSPDQALTAGVMEAAKTEGLLIGKGGLYGNTLRIAPPLSITEEEAEEGLDKLTRAIDRAREEQP
jgi:4-aminobutyrate aminotransferase